MARRIGIVVLALVVVFAGIVTVAVASQRRLIYLPSADVAAPPEGLNTEPLQIITSDGLSLQGTFVPAVGEPIGTVVVFNGNAGNRGDRYPIAAEFSEAGFHTVLFDYRGYGGNPGSPSESGLIADGLAAVAHARTLLGVDPARIAYYGESLGTGVAVAVAAVDSPAILILRSPYTSLPDVAAAAVPFAPVRPLIWDEFPTERTIADIAAPVVVVAGTADATIPVAQSAAVFEAVPGEKLLVVVEGAGHNDRAVSSEVIARTDFQNFVRRFLAVG